MRLIDAITLKAEFTGNFKDEYTKAEIHALIDLAPTIGGWISVKDRLPKKNGKYIVFSESPICKSMLFANFAKNLQKIDRNAFYEMKRPGWYEYDSEWGYSELNYITHWMPRPKPPEGG